MNVFNPKKIKRKKAVVLGLGRSGEACARLLVSKGFSVFGSDLRKKDEVKRGLGRHPGKLTCRGAYLLKAATRNSTTYRKMQSLSVLFCVLTRVVLELFLSIPPKRKITTALR